MEKVLLWIGIFGLSVGLIFAAFNLSGPSDTYGFAACCVGLLLVFLAGVLIPPKTHATKADEKLNDYLSLYESNEERD